MNKPHDMKKPKLDKNQMKSLGRVMKLLLGYYPVLVPITAICIIFSSFVSAIPALFQQNIIASIERWYPTGDWESAIQEILPLILILIVLYVLSIASMIVYTQLMAYITQGFLSKLRCTLFDKMQDLPIRYFDTHRHGDISCYCKTYIRSSRRSVRLLLRSRRFGKHEHRAGQDHPI